MKTNKNLFIAIVLILTIGLLSCGKKEKIAEKETTKKETTGKMKISKTEYMPGEEIKLTFETEGDFDKNAWIGIIPADIPRGDESRNDQHDVSYQYLRDKKSGELVFKAPEQPGTYDFRMHTSDQNGKEVTTLTFTVKEEEVEEETGDTSLEINKKIYKSGEEIVITFKAPDSWPKNAWIGIIPSDAPHGDETENDKVDVAYVYLNKKTSGEVTLKAPAESGSYDIRMHDTDQNGKEVEYVSFKVK
ncbi:hypothetical protein ACFLSV_00095 [Bacteroidota bacterium]